MPTDPLQPRTDLRRRVLAGEVTFGAFAGLGLPDRGRDPGSDRARLGAPRPRAQHADRDRPAARHLRPADDAATALVRVEEGTRLRIGRALDFGAEGVMIPRLETVEQAADAVSWMRFPPDGMRGLALSTRGAGQSSVAHADVHKLNALPVGIFQIESPAAVANADAMAALDGVDVLFVGPTDLSHSLGVPGQFQHPTFLAALDSVAAACRAHGKAAGILLKGAEDVPAYLDRGYTFIGLGSDGGWISNGARVVLEMARDFMR